MNNPDVKFVASKSYLDMPLIDDILVCTHGRKEIVVECNSELKGKLRNLHSDYFQPRLKDLKKYLSEQGLTYQEDFKNTLTL